MVSMQHEIIRLQQDFIVVLEDIEVCGAQMPTCTVVPPCFFFLFFRFYFIFKKRNKIPLKLVKYSSGSNVADQASLIQAPIGCIPVPNSSAANP